MEYTIILILFCSSNLVLTESEIKQDTDSFRAIDATSTRESYAHINGSRLTTIGFIDGKYFFTEDAHMNWVEALNFCQASFMKLARVTSAEQHTLVSQFLQGMGGRRGCWLSATDIFSENEFYWMTNGEALTYTNWGLGHPHWDNTERNYVILNSYGNYWENAPYQFVTDFVIMPLCEL